MKITAILFLLLQISVAGNAHKDLISDSLNNESYSMEYFIKSKFEVSSTISNSESENQYDSSNETLRRKARPFGVGIHAFGPSLAYGSLYVDYFIAPLLELEIGTDIRSFYGGLILYPFANKKDPAVTPYFGAYLNYTSDYILYELSDAPVKGFKGYFPVGLQVFSNSGLIICPEIAFSTPEYLDLSNIYWGMKVGYKFKRIK